MAIFIHQITRAVISIKDVPFYWNNRTESASTDNHREREDCYLPHRPEDGNFLRSRLVLHSSPVRHVAVHQINCIYEVEGSDRQTPTFK